MRSASTCCIFPTPMLGLGFTPRIDVEVALARAYNRWLCDEVLAHEPRICSSLYLPMNDPEAAYKVVEEFAGRKGVVGFTGARRATSRFTTTPI